MTNELALDPRVNETLDLITSLASGRLDARSEPTGAGDVFDAILTGLNMLAEELEATTDELNRERSGLEQKVSERTAVLQSVLDNMSEGVIVADVQGNFRIFNKAAAEILGMKETAVSMQEWSKQYGAHDPKSGDLCPPEQLPLAKAMQGVATSGVELLIRNQYLARPALISTSGRPVFDQSHQLCDGVIVFRDITRQRSSEKALQEARAGLEATVAMLERHNREAALLAEMSDGMMASADEIEAYDVAAFFLARLLPEMTGALFVFRSSRDSVEIKAKFGSDVLEDEEQVFAPNDCWAMRRGKLHAVAEVETPFACAHAHSIQEGYVCVPLAAAGETLGLLHVRLKSDEIENVRSLLMTAGERLSLSLFNLRLRSALRNLSIRDPLTTLYNRRYLEEALAREIKRAERNNRPLGVIMADLDHFKEFNDAYGHTAGDDLLRSVGLFFRDNLRGGDVACRYGGEEFTLILADAGVEDVVKRTEMMRQEIKKLTIDKDRQKVGSMTMSFGISEYPRNGKSFDSLITSADKALYTAKARGRDRVVLAETETGAEPATSHEIEN